MKAIKLNNNFGFILIVTAFLLPTLFFGFTADDRQWVYTSTFGVNIEGMSLLDKIRVVLLSMERFFPISLILLTSAFHYFDYSNAWIYHSLILVFNIVVFYSFLKFIDELEIPYNKNWLTCLLLITMQIRPTYNDPIISNFGMLQFSALMLFIGLASILRYMRSGSVIQFIIAVLATIFQLLNYEMALFMMPVSFYIIYRRKFMSNIRFIKISIVLLLVLLFYFFVYFHVSQSALKSYSGIQLSIDFFSILKALAIQASGSFPLIYYFYIFALKFDIPLYFIWSLYFAILACISVILFASLFRRMKNFDISLFCIGLLIWICAAASISFSKRYQDELILGHAYTVVYVQNFGFAIALFVLLNHYSKSLRIAISSLLIITFSINSLLIYKAIQIDNTKLILTRVLSGENLLINRNYTITIINERLFQDIGMEQKIIKPNFGRLYFLDRREIKRFDPRDLGAGVALSYGYSSPFSGSYVILGEFSSDCACLSSGVVITDNLDYGNTLSLKLDSMHFERKFDRLGGLYFFDFVNLPLSSDLFKII